MICLYCMSLPFPGGMCGPVLAAPRDPDVVVGAPRDTVTVDNILQEKHLNCPI